MAKRDETRVSDPKPVKCANCSAVLGPEAKTIGISVDDGGAGKEDWCPRCFAYHRTALEPGRWSHIFAVHCPSCGCDTVAFGELACGQCGRKGVVVLPPPRSASPIS
jgi:ribosomal protein S27E